MPFNLLVTSCFHQGTKFKDTGDSAEITLNPDNAHERIIFFRIDESGRMDSPFRKEYNMTNEGQRICDLLVYYKNLDTDQQYLVLTETKGTDFDGAADQIMNTYRKMALHNCLCRKRYCKDIVIRVCGISKRLNKYTNTDAKKAKGKIIDSIKIDKNDCVFIDPHNFHRFLRGEKVSTI